jgi:hypothetical protein
MTMTPIDPAAKAARTAPASTAAAVEPGPSPPVAGPGTPAGGAPASASPAGPYVPCGHGIGIHEIRGNGTRGACLFIAGPHGTRCACKGQEFAAGDSR